MTDTLLYPVIFCIFVIEGGEPQVFMEEIWRDIENYEGLYQVSNLGRVKSCIRETNNQYGKEERILKPEKTEAGYLRVILSNSGSHKPFLVHRLVAIAFIPNPHNLPQVNHKNECKTLNVVDNLEWCDRTYNVNYGSRNDRQAKSLGKRICQYDKSTGELIATYWACMEAYRKTGVNYANISACCHNRLPSAGGYIWRYEK